MPRPKRIETLNDMKVWIADHDGRIDAYWEAQHIWNKKIEIEFKDFGLRISSCEKKIMYFAGAAAALGSVVGAFVANTLT